MAKILNIIKYGISRIKTIEIKNEYLDWLMFANAGMMNKGNIYLFDYAIKNIKTNSPIIEIGSFCGLSTNIISYFLKKYVKTNTIITSDKWFFEGGEKSDFMGDSNIKAVEYREFVKQSYIRNIQTFSKQNLPFTIEEFADDFFKLWQDNAIQKDVLGREIKLGGKISFCFIDGNHSYDFVKNDFENTDKFLEKDGFILFDDSAGYYDFGSSKLMKEILKNPKYKLACKNPNYLFQKISE